MSDVTEARNAIASACWVSDVMVKGLPAMLAFTRDLEVNAPSAEAAARAKDIRRGLEGMAVALGILQEALATIALATPEGSA